MADVSAFISSVGFPIFVAVFMLYKSSKDTATLTETVNELRVAIIELSTLFKNVGGGDE